MPAKKLPSGVQKKSRTYFSKKCESDSFYFRIGKTLDIWLCMFNNELYTHLRMVPMDGKTFCMDAKYMYLMGILPYQILSELIKKPIPNKTSHSLESHTPRDIYASIKRAEIPSNAQPIGDEVEMNIHYVENFPVGDEDLTSEIEYVANLAKIHIDPIEMKILRNLMIKILDPAVNNFISHGTLGYYEWFYMYVKIIFE